MIGSRLVAVALAFAAVVVLLFVTNPPDISPDASTTTIGPSTTEETIEPDPSLRGLPGRLLVIETDGAILTMDPDGTERITIAPAQPGITERSLPFWSPGGDLIAWTERHSSDDVSLVVATRDGDPVGTLDIPVLASYMAWGPSGGLIALTGDDGRGNQHLFVADVGSGTTTTVAEGSPMYFDWHPDGGQLLVHSGDSVFYVSADGTRSFEVAAGGEFRVPTHLNGSLVLGYGRDVGETLSVSTPGGEVTAELIRYATPMAFVIDDLTQRIALLSKGSSANQRLSGVTDIALPILRPNSLVVLDGATGEVAEVAQGQGVSWSFSPDGKLLLYSTLETIGSTQRLVWRVWDGSSSLTFASFSPSGRFGREFLAFFDQFDRAASIWAPDGSAFAYSGGNDLSDLGIWVQRIDSAEPVRVGRGLAAFWSPAG